MGCNNPVYALDLGINKETGKRKIKILGKRPDLSTRQQLEARYGSSVVLALPCGHCLACKINYSKEWSIRCVCESRLYDESKNFFITLTYDDQHNPGILRRSDVQDFIRKLRRLSPGVRYFGCGEYGEHTKRPHYHLILFNLNLTDLKCEGKIETGYFFISEIIGKCWSNGQYMLNQFSYSTANYVARYNMKKIFKDENDKKEFLMYSLKPGIGEGFYRKFKSSIYPDDCIYLSPSNGGKVRPPRYFDKLFERDEPDIFAQVKENRLKNSRLSMYSEMIQHGLENYEQVQSIKEDSLMDGLKKKKLTRGDF